MSWNTRLEQSQREAEWYKSNCEELKQEISTLNAQKEKLYSEQIAGLERQVRQMTRERTLSGKSFDPSHEPGDKMDVEVQTIAKTTKEDDEDEMENITMDGLLRLEEHKAMLLRTGVYTTEDHVVIKLQEQIKKMRRKIEAEKDT